MRPQRITAFDEIVRRLVEDDPPQRILDLGAGDGALSGLVLDELEDSKGVLVDFSETMMRRGRQQLMHLSHRVEYVDWDMNHGGWPFALGSHFDAILSSSALHHLESARKGWMCNQVREHLGPGGVFANFDFFRVEGSEPPVEDTHAWTCGTLAENVIHLEGAGFGDVEIAASFDCPSQYHQFTLMFASSSR